MKHSPFYILIVGLGILLRLYQIDNEFAQDELFSVQIASASFGHLLTAALADSTHTPLHLILLHLWLRLWGISEVSARALSVVASGLFLLLLYRVALRWMREESALVVLILCAASPFFVYYGQFARPYALVPLWLTLSIYFLYKSQDDPSNQLYKIVYGVSCAAVVYTQYIGVFVLIPQFVALALSRERVQRTLLLYGLGGMLSILPWLLLSIGENFQPQGLEERIGWLPRPTLFALPAFFVDVLWPLRIRGIPRVFVLLSTSILLPIIVKSGERVWQQFMLLASIAFLGPIIILILSRSSPLSIWAPRQMIGSACFFVVLLGFGLNLHRRWLGYLLASVLVGGCIATLPTELSYDRNPPWREIVSVVQQKCPDCDVVVEGGGWTFLDPLRYYSHREVHAVEDYKNRLDKTKPIAFLCRPVQCESLQDIAYHAKIRESRSMAWYTGGPYHTFQIYFFVQGSA